MRLVKQVGTALAAVLLALVCVSGGVAGEEKSLRGYVVDVAPDGSFRVDSAPELPVAPAQGATVGFADASGPERLLVGMEVEVKGRLESPGGPLQAREVSVVSKLESEAEGTAVVDGRSVAGDDLVLTADGRTLLVGAETRLSPPESDGVEAIEELASVRPGVFVHYRGRWGADGWVGVEELSAWKNPVEKKEGELYERYEPSLMVPATEKSGPPVLRVDKNRYQVLEDNQTQLYIDRLGTSLLPVLWRDKEWTERLGYKLWFLVAVHKRPQASAFPSGVVVVHSGLFRSAENEAQLAFVLAHETAHVLQEHPWREYQYHRGKLLFLRWSTAGLGYVVESAIRHGYQRELEAQADRLALYYMTQAGYDPRQALALLRTLEKKQPGLPTLLWDTHRSYGQRRKALLQELTRYSQAGLDYGVLRRDSPEFALLQSRMVGAWIEKVETVPQP